MDLMSLFIKIGVKDNASSEISSIASKATSTIKSVFSAVAIEQATEKVVEFTKTCVEAYGEYEQLQESLDLLYKDGSTYLKDAADNAYQLGMSASTYMSNVQKFSGALLISLDNDQQKAAQIAANSMNDIVDQSAAYGQSIEDISEVYLTLARGNYRTLDNLFGGMFKGTKDGLNELLDYAEEYKAGQGEVVEYSIDSYADILEALHVVTVATGVTGEAAREAGKDVEVSLQVVSAAWDNLLVAIADDEGSISERTEQLGESLVQAFEVVSPHVYAVFGNVMTGIQQLTPYIVDLLPRNVQNSLNQISEMVSPVVDSISTTITEAISFISTTFDSFVTSFNNTFEPIVGPSVDNLITAFDNLNNTFNKTGEFAKTLGDFLSADVTANMTFLVTIATSCVDAVNNLANAFGPYLEPALERASEIFREFSEHLEKAQPFFDAVATVVGGALVGAFVSLLSAIEAGMYIFDAVVDFFTTAPEAWSEGLSNASEFVDGIVESIQEFPSKFAEAAKECADGFVNGLKEAPIIGDVISTFESVVSGVKSLLGIAPPSTVFSDIGMNLVQGFIDGINGLGETLLTTVSELVTNLITNVTTAVGDFVNNIIATVTDWASQVVAANQQMASDALAAISDFVSNAISSFADWASNLISSAQSMASSAGAAISDFVSSALSAIANWASEMISQASSTAQSFADNIINGLSGIADQLYSIGSNMISGLIGGIQSMAQAAVDAVSGVINGAISAAESLLGIASPSKVFAKIGDFTMEGLAQGIEKSYGDVEKALNDTVGSMGSMSMSINANSVPTATAARGGTVYNFYIDKNAINVGGDMESAAIEFANSFRRHYAM